MAESYQYLKEFIGLGLATEGQLLVPRQIYDNIVEEVGKALIPRSEAALYFGPAQIPGSSIDVDLETVNIMDVRVIAEGAEIWLDQPEFSSTNLRPTKYGAAVRITREMLEDGKWNLLDYSLRILGKRFAENENSLVITALDGAANTVSGGAAVTVPNITRAMQYLEDSDYKPTSFVVGPEVLKDLRDTDLFTDFSRSGNNEMLTRGFLGNIFGMNVMLTSANAGMTSTSAYVFDREHGYMMAEKRTITIENFDLPSYDMSAAAVTQRITVAALRTSSIAKITST